MNNRKQSAVLIEDTLSLKYAREFLIQEISIFAYFVNRSYIEVFAI